MPVWETYPENYRANEVRSIIKAVDAGECVSVIGLSGAGKSNLIGFLAHRSALAGRSILIDCNRLAQPDPGSFFRLVRRGLGDVNEVSDELFAFENALDQLMSENGPLCLLFDRFDALPDSALPLISSNLRALRDAYKYQLTYVTATRRPLDPHSELAELFYAHTLWLGPLSESDVRWNVTRYADRIGVEWGSNVADMLIKLTWGYPSLLRAACEAYASMDAPPSALTLDSLRDHLAVQRRVEEFWADAPDESSVEHSGLKDHPLLGVQSSTALSDDSQLTAKEHALLAYFQAHPDQVCEKDDLVRAVWPEDHIFERGVRDDSLAQLIRRLRQKVEADASDPQHILTVPGRGYRFIP